MNSDELKFQRDPRQLETAREAARHAGAAGAAVRWRFIARTDLTEQPPPMARILRGGGGRGGATRLKLFLSLLWLARGRPDPVFGYPAQQLASLLGLSSPSAAGARRIHQALKWLHDENFLALEHRPGEAARIHMLDDAGSGAAYQAPGPLVSRKRKHSTDREKHFYVQLKRELWTEGWISHLSGAAIAMYLAALHEERGKTGEAVWISPRIGRERYDLSDETRGKGFAELVNMGLLNLAKRPVPQTSFDERYRARNVYRVVPNGLARVHGKSRDVLTSGDSLDPFAATEDVSSYF
ncbi:hypothetical protein [Micromonospora maris]|uniref:hypothetical protein n=1 Tax=Micromonospora maris TaxID=1003110 RepID=UPI000206B37B|nr:hypothetical protein [Micromonospora maris]AEB48012.1 hypothetical protein VAB18032_30244 [Micromonospora maris AB-18-032]